MTEEDKIAYEEGRLAATNAEPLSACPYEAGSARHAAWRQGYGYVAESGKLGEPND